MIRRYYQNYIRQYPLLNKIAHIFGRIFSVIYSSTLFLTKKYFSAVCMFFCTLFFLTLLYLPLPVFFQITFSIAIVVVASMGLSFLDYKERLYEDSVESQMLETARRQLTLNVDHDPTHTAPALPPVVNKGELKPYQQTIKNSIPIFVRSFGLDVLEFCTLENDSDTETYVYNSTKDLTGEPNKINKAVIKLQQSLKLKGFPTVKIEPDQVFVTIRHTDLPQDILS